MSLGVKTTALGAAAGTALLSAFVLMPPFATPANADTECQQWDIAVPNHIVQSNGWTVTLESAVAAKSYLAGSDRSGIPGTVTFEPNDGNNVRFTITWQKVPNDPGARDAAGIYTGQIDRDGFVSGRTQDKWHPESTADWHMDSVAHCLKRAPVPSPPAPAAPAPAPVPAATQNTATVISDVDVYNIAHTDESDDSGVVGAKIGTLRAGQQVQLARACQPNGWCQVLAPELPGGNGFVLGHLQF